MNHPTVGRVPGGATIERAAPTVSPSGRVKLQLMQPDFTTALRISTVINEKFCGRKTAARQAGEFGVGGGDNSAGVRHSSGGIYFRDRSSGGAGRPAGAGSDQ